LALLLPLGSACDELRADSEPRVVGEFGVFYGGQVQERQEIPFELDRTRQVHGFRLELQPPPEHPLEVRWELGLPGSGRVVKDGQGRKARARRAQVGTARWRPGEAQFEQALAFSAGDPLGLWNMRVLVGSQVVIDRPFWVYDEARPGRPELESSDAGI